MINELDKAVEVSLSTILDARLSARFEKLERGVAGHVLARAKSSFDGAIDFADKYVLFLGVFFVVLDAQVLPSGRQSFAMSTPKN